MKIKDGDLLMMVMKRDTDSPRSRHVARTVNDEEIRERERDPLL